MGVLTKEVFLKQAEVVHLDDDWRNVIRQAKGVLRDYTATIESSPVNEEAALAMYEQLKDYVVRYGSLPGKSFRPYNIPDLIETNLDRSKAWWGFEFETGYVSQEAMSKVISHVWDTWDNVTFDPEGEGAYLSEITFAPAHAEDFANGTAPAYQFMQYLSDNRVLTNRTDYNMVGTHINISLPEFANGDCTGNEMFRAVQTLNYVLGKLTANQKLELFGRAQLYGGFYERSAWIEGKLFRTTYIMEQFQTYVRTAKGLTNIAKFAAVTPNVGEEAVDKMTNLIAMLYDPDNNPVPVFEEGTEFNKIIAFSGDDHDEYSDEDEDYDDCDCDDDY